MVEYDYNNLNQLLNATDPAQAFSYDAAGNMTQGYTTAQIIDNVGNDLVFSRTVGI